MLNSRQVEAFRAVMLDGGMTAATESLHITQPAVSRLIKDLEEDLGLRLFDRLGNKITPTAEAIELLTEVERSYIGLDALRAYADNLRGMRAGSLRIAALPAMAVSFLPQFVASFSQDRPDVRIQLDGLPSYLVLDRVAGGQYDLGVSSMISDRPSLTHMAIDAFAVVVLPVHHRLAKLKQIAAPDLAGESIIMLYNRLPLTNLIEAALQSVSYRRVIETTFTSTACELALAGAGVAIVDRFSAHKFKGGASVVRPFVPLLKAEYRLVHSSYRQLSRLAQQFITEFVNYLATAFDDGNT